MDSEEAYGKNEIVKIIDMSDFLPRQHERIGDGSSEAFLTPAEHVYVPSSPSTAASIGLDEWRNTSGENP